MKKADVPQDKNIILDGVRKAVYALDEQGNYTMVPSDGWEAEEIVTTMAVDALKLQAKQAKERYLAGESSALEYHMYDKRMDLTLLSQTTGMAKWRIRRHLKPAVFAKLKPAMLARYAEALGMTAEGLKSVD